jgi:hypothetical protein
VPTWILTYKNAVNSGAFSLDNVTIAARQAKLSSIKISTWQERNDIRYRVVSFAIHLKDYGETWDKVWLNQGMWCLSSLDDLIERCTDRNGAYITGMLDASGYQIDQPTPDNVVLNTTKIYQEKDFSALPLT